MLVLPVTITIFIVAITITVIRPKPIVVQAPFHVVSVVIQIGEAVYGARCDKTVIQSPFYA